MSSRQKWEQSRGQGGSPEMTQVIWCFSTVMREPSHTGPILGTVRFQLAVVFRCSRVGLVQVFADLKSNSDINLERCLFTVCTAYIMNYYVLISFNTQ